MSIDAAAITTFVPDIAMFSNNSYKWHHFRSYTRTNWSDHVFPTFIYLSTIRPNQILSKFLVKEAKYAILHFTAQNLNFLYFSLRQIFFFTQFMFWTFQVINLKRKAHLRFKSSKAAKWKRNIAPCSIHIKSIDWNWGIKYARKYIVVLHFQSQRGFGLTMRNCIFAKHNFEVLRTWKQQFLILLNCKLSIQSPKIGTLVFNFSTSKWLHTPGRFAQL